MSELTPCNHCSLKRIQLRAKRQGKRLVLKPHPLPPFAKGHDLYLLKPGERPNKRNKIGWMAEITDRCVC